MGVDARLKSMLDAIFMCGHSKLKGYCVLSPTKAQRPLKRLRRDSDGVRFGPPTVKLSGLLAVVTLVITLALPAPTVGRATFPHSTVAARAAMMPVLGSCAVLSSWGFILSH